MLERDGSVLLNTGPKSPSDAKLRRVQACAQHSPIGIEIARHLVDLKLARQEDIERKRLRDPAAADLIALYRRYASKAETYDELRGFEGTGVGHYWPAWKTIEVVFPEADLPRVPDHWRRFGSRRSLISSNTRRAPNPLNAILNYLYTNTVLESETRIAVNALGLDPGLGLLHVDDGIRDSLVYDLMEPIRPCMDAYVLDWITEGTLKRAWFFELNDGCCRMMSDLAVQLSDTASLWATEIAPVVEWLVQKVSTTISGARPAGTATRLTRRKRYEAKGTEQPKPKPIRKQHDVCLDCGRIVTPGVLQCYTCVKEFGSKRVEDSSKEQTAKSNLRKTPMAEKISQHREAQREWKPSDLPDWLDEAFYLDKIQPALQRLDRISKQTVADGLEMSLCSIRCFANGTKIPHRRHWVRLAELVGVGALASGSQEALGRNLLRRS